MIWPECLTQTHPIREDSFFWIFLSSQKLSYTYPKIYDLLDCKVHIGQLARYCFHWIGPIEHAQFMPAPVVQRAPVTSFTQCFSSPVFNECCPSNAQTQNKCERNHNLPNFPNHMSNILKVFNQKKDIQREVSFSYP